MNAKINVRDATVSDLPGVLRLNQSALPHVSSLTPDSLRLLFDGAASFHIATIDGNCAGFLIALRPGSQYRSENYLWFAQRYSTFLYIDRVCVSSVFRRCDVASTLYAGAEKFAGQSDIPLLACEVNLRPENLASSAFHDRQGFQNVGTQRTENGTKLVSLCVRHLPLDAPKGNNQQRP